jgi:uncharacterized protein YndB with AHSA1/START domain
MSRPIRIVLGILIAVLGLAALVTIVGAFMPRDHVATSEVTLRQPPDSVWLVLRDFGAMPSWWSEMKSSSRVEGASGERWKQDVGGFPMELDVLEATAPARMVTRVVEEKGAPFGGTWTYNIIPATSGGTTVRITEAGWIGPPPFRVMGRLFGLHATIDGLLVALGQRFGETVTPVHTQ